MPKVGDQKINLDQFCTNRVDLIFDHFEIPNHVSIIEPFVGNGMLLNWIQKRTSAKVEIYDIDPSSVEGTVIRDAIRDPPDYEGK